MRCRCVVAAGSDLFGEREAPTRRALLDVDAGDTFAVAVDCDARVVGWGRGFYGELGETAEVDEAGEDENGRSPASCVRELPAPVDCARVACGRNHVLVLSRDGASVFAWGSNRWGQVGDVPEAVVTTPMCVQLSDAGRVQSVAAGGMHSLAVDASARVWSWGQSKLGQLGRESAGHECCRVPGLVALPTGVEALQVCAGWAHSAIVSTDGRVLTFGWGLYHQLGHGTTQDERSPLPVDALDGLGDSGRVAQVACGTWHTVARTASGDLYSWGWGPDGQLGHGQAVLSQAYPRVVDLSVASALASASSGSGMDECGGDASDVMDIACGARLTACLLRCGDVAWCGRSGSGSGHSSASEMAWRVAPRHEGGGRVRKIAAGVAHVFGLIGSEAAGSLEGGESSAFAGDSAPQ